MKEKLIQFIAEQGLKQSQVAKQLGCSAAALNQYLQGKYKGDTKKLDGAVAAFLERKARAVAEPNWGFVRTTTAARILEICALAHSLSELHLIVGEAGLGKTCAIAEYSKTQKGSAVLLEADPTFNPKVLLNALASELGLEFAGRTNNDIMQALIKQLHGTGKVIIVDEAEHLGYRPLEILRRIHDKAQIGLVLVGLPRLRANLRGSRGEYKQLYSRVGLALDLFDRLPENDIFMMSEAVLNDSSLNKVLNEASRGNARRLSKILKGVLRLSEINKTDISEKMIKSYAKMLID